MTQNNFQQKLITLPKSICKKGLKKGVCRNVNQKVILVRDASGSMSGQKSKDAFQASLQLIEELARPENKDGFLVAIVDFASGAKIVQPLTKASALCRNVPPLSASGGTDMIAGLRNAYEILQQSGQADGLTYLKPVVLCFSDGHPNQKPTEIANSVKAIADLVTIAFGKDAKEPLLREIATSAKHFYRCQNGSELRHFMAEVGSTVSKTLVAGQNATQALTQIQI